MGGQLDQLEPEGKADNSLESAETKPTLIRRSVMTGGAKNADHHLTATSVVDGMM